ncbi:uncharacterized protein LOC111563003 [Amphiprion ocellaris]|uniref:uncharacterized protein LOC111563003 n=1 Tax=Amphiprion ocellaris TaxID=80972 RepID=UPI000C31B04A|nr:uncharacterized protein LOC111563003 [Amphiprion ocellaris]XP_054873362.1 uncharacterized protein LOC111563003 [Amphiprion ocellaris]
MILTGRSLCLPSPVTVQELFSAARDASIIPDISLDPVLTTFLSLDSSAALQHQYDFLQRSMSREQQAAFGLNLTAELGGSRVTYGGVGVIALALSLLFDQVAQQIRAQDSADGHPSAHRSQPAMIFGISTSSRIGSIIHSYLGLVPGIANSQEKMGETTELFDSLLKLELLDHYERMTTKKRMSSVSMQQWLTGAAFHLHLRIHQVRLNSVPSGSAESLRLSYKSGLGLLVQGYTAYLRRNIQETEAPGPQKPRTRAGDRPRQTSSMTNVTCSSISADKFNDSASLNSTAGFSGSCKTNRSNKDFGLSVVKGSNDTSEDVINRNTANTSSGYKGEEEASQLGLLVIEPLRNVSHNIQHHPCESPAIQQALVTRIINTLDLEQNRDFFLYSSTVFYSLVRQKNDFELKTN